MKRFISILLAGAAIVAFSATASAQVANHLALGVGVGFDGVSLEAGLPLGSHFQVRAGGAYTPPAGRDFQITGVEYEPGEFIDLDLHGQFAFRGFNMMVDMFPSAKSRFRFTVGMYAGPGHIVSVHNNTPYLDEEDWGTAGITIGDTFITTDDTGVSRANLDVNKVMPYLGIGGGRAACKSGVNFLFDFGACYSGGLKVCTHGQNLRTGEDSYVRISSADVDNRDEGVIDILGKIPVLPMMRFSLFFTIF